MCIKRDPEYYNIVQVGKTGAVEHFAEDDCHHAHEYGECRCKSKHHDFILKMSERRTERSFLSVFSMDLNLIVSHC